jgi:transcription elongation factor GreB
MSKAFTKETDGDEPEGPDEQDTELGKLPSRKNYMTPACAVRMRAELKQLLTVDRPALTQVVAWAASNGDRSENADYTYGKRKLREMDRRLRFLQKRLEAAEIVDPADPTRKTEDRVLFGATVVVRGEDGTEKTYRIVGIDETDARKGYVSWISPIAKALLNLKAGDAATLRTPRGEEELELVAVRYESFD